MAARKRLQQPEFRVVAAVVAVQRQEMREAPGTRVTSDHSVDDAHVLVEPAAAQQHIGEDLLRSLVARSNRKECLRRLQTSRDVTQLGTQDKLLHQHLRSPIPHLVHREQHVQGLLVVPVARQHCHVLILSRNEEKAPGQ